VASRQAKGRCYNNWAPQKLSNLSDCCLQNLGGGKSGGNGKRERGTPNKLVDQVHLMYCCLQHVEKEIAACGKGNVEQNMEKECTRAVCVLCLARKKENREGVYAKQENSQGVNARGVCAQARTTKKEKHGKGERRVVRARESACAREGVTHTDLFI